jgi:hypothetical protein
MKKQKLENVSDEPVFPVSFEIEILVGGERRKGTRVAHYRGVTRKVRRELAQAYEANAQAGEPEDLGAVQLSVLVKKIEGVDHPLTPAFFDSVLLGDSFDNLVAAIEQDIAGPENSPSDSVPST